MKSKMRMSDLKVADGFPPRLNRNKLVVVQIPNKETPGVILYTDKEGDMQWEFLTVTLNYRYESKIYIIYP